MPQNKNEDKDYLYVFINFSSPIFVRGAEGSRIIEKPQSHLVYFVVKQMTLTIYNKIC